MQRIACLVVMLVACGGSAALKAAPTAGAPSSGGGGGPPAGPGATSAEAANQVIPEALVVEGSLSLEITEIGDVVPSLRAKVEAVHGRIISENITGGEQSWGANLRLRLPPDKVQEVVDFLGTKGEITAKNISANDVSKQLFDQELAIKNLRTTLDRLTALMDKNDLQVAQILQIETEMTRIRGQIEQLEGDQRFLKDRVALATIDVAITRRDGAPEVAHAKFYPGARAAMLTLFGAGSRKANRFGGGIVVHPILRNLSLEVDVFQKELDASGMSSSVSAIGTIGGATYSDFLGGGRRAMFNPYLGLRLGGGYLDGGRFVAQGELGVELYKAKYVVIDANVRATGLFGNDTDFALITGFGATVAF